MTVPQSTEEVKEFEMKVDQKRYDVKDEYGTSGIFVRAKVEGKWDSVDMVLLEKESLKHFLKSRGGDNAWAEDIVGILLGHGHLSS